MTNVWHKQLIIAPLLSVCDVGVETDSVQNQFHKSSGRCATAEVIEEDEESVCRGTRCINRNSPLLMLRHTNLTGTHRKHTMHSK